MLTYTITEKVCFHHDSTSSNSATINRMKLGQFTMAVFAIVAAVSSFAAPPAESSKAASAWKLPPVDILIFAPHSDDEAIGCTGVMLQALERKQQVGVVVITAGDAHVGAAAAVAGKEQGKLA